MKTRALKIAAAAVLIITMLVTAAGAATITKTKFNSGTGEVTVWYYASGDEAVISAYDAENEANVIYFDQQSGGGTGSFKFTIPEDFSGNTVAVKVGGTNEASATAFVSVTPSPSPTPDPESTEAGGIYNYVAKEPFAEDTVTVNQDEQTIYTDSDFDIYANASVWKGLANTDDCFSFSSGAMYVDPVKNIGCEDIMIKFASISEGTVKITFDAKLATNGKTWTDPSYFGAVVNSESKKIAAGMAKVWSFNGRTILDNTSTQGIVRFDSAKNSDGKYTSYNVICNDSALHNFEYIIDMDNKTYTISLDGTKVGEYDFYDTDIECIDALRFSGNSYGDAAHNNSVYSVDNIVVKSTQNIETNNLKFYNETGTKLVREMNVRPSKQILPPTAPAKRGATFVCWTTEPNGKGDRADFSAISTDMTVYAAYMTKPTITYISGGEVYDAQVVDYNSTITAPVLENKGEYEFVGWYTADGSLANFNNITEDMTVYAKFGKAVVSAAEDFETSFSLDTANKSMTTGSGFNFSAESNAYNFLQIKYGGLYMGARGQASANNQDNSVYAKFPSVTSGKILFSFDLKTDNIAFQNWISVFGGPFITVGNADDSARAVSLYMRGIDTSNQSEKTYLATAKGSSGDTSNVIGTLNKNKDYIHLEYIIDMDAKTYSVTCDGNTTVNMPFTNAGIAEISQIKFPLPSQGSAQYSYSNWQVDNISVKSYVMEGEETKQYTVTFYDEDGVTVLDTVTVKEGQTAVYGGNTPSKAATAQYTYTFGGWDKSLENITSDTTVKAVYTATVNRYTVTFVDYDGTTVLGTSTVDYGTAAAAPKDPSREADEQYTYTFSGWDKSFNNVTENMTVTAQYTASPIGEDSYITLIWGDFNGDGNISMEDITPIRSKIKGNAIMANGYKIGELIPGTSIIWGDLNGDGNISMEDITPIRSKIKGNAINANGYIIGEEVKIPVKK